MNIRLDLKMLELNDSELVRYLWNRLFQERDHDPKLEQMENGKKAFAYYVDDWSREHASDERHEITRDPEKIKVIEAFYAIKKYLDNHGEPI